MIQPTVGRVVLFHPGSGFTGAVSSDKAPLPALISRVWNDRMINLGGFDVNGQPFAATSVLLVQGDETGAPPTGHYAEWMPYQKGQAAKTEALEKKSATEAEPDEAYQARQAAHCVAFAAMHQVPHGGDAGRYAEDVAKVYNKVYDGIVNRMPDSQKVFQIRADDDGIVWLHFANGMVSLNDVALNLGPFTGGALQAAIRKLVG